MAAEDFLVRGDELPRTSPLLLPSLFLQVLEIPFPKVLPGSRDRSLLRNLARDAGRWPIIFLGWNPFFFSKTDRSPPKREEIPEDLEARAIRVFLPILPFFSFSPEVVWIVLGTGMASRKCGFPEAEVVDIGHSVSPLLPFFPSVNSLPRN